MDWFEDYLKHFEAAVANGVRSGLLGAVKPVTVAPGKLSKKRIGKLLGRVVSSKTGLVVDYYGYMKKSIGFQDMVAEVAEAYPEKQIKTVVAPVVHFNSVRLETLAKIEPLLVERFGEFKKTILDARRFRHNYKG